MLTPALDKHVTLSGTVSSICENMIGVPSLDELRNLATCCYNRDILVYEVTC
jgi:hypothetical protein